jgi:molybdopterin-guanine dinucleotide biosynthesis protein A
MDVDAFVLIGGRSSRMGQDKALIKLDGVTLAQRAVDTMREAFPSAKISLVARDKKQFAVEALPKDVPVTYDQYKDRGAYSGLHVALSSAKTERLFVTACDYPFVSVELIRYLAGITRKEFAAVVPLQPDGRAQPLCAFYRVAPCLEVIAQMLRTGEKLPPLRAVFEKVETRFVEFDEVGHLPGAEKFFLNLNTQEDLENVSNSSVGM